MILPAAAPTRLPGLPCSLGLAVLAAHMALAAALQAWVPRWPAAAQRVPPRLLRVVSVALIAATPQNSAAAAAAARRGGEAIESSVEFPVRFAFKD